MLELTTNKSSNAHLERLCLISDREEFLLKKELLKSQHVIAMEEIMQAYAQEDYAMIQQALAKISDISADIKLINCQIRNIDNQLSQVCCE